MMHFPAAGQRILKRLILNRGENKVNQFNHIEPKRELRQDY